MKTYPLLQSQLGVLLESMQHPESSHYNLPNYIFMPLSMTRERVVGAVQKLVESFPELHTRFVIGEQGEVRQWCDLSMPIPVVSRKCSEEELQTYIREGFVRPFDPLGNEPLFRVEVVETEKCFCVLFDGYHAIMDGMSFAPIVSTAFARIFDGERVESQPYSMYQAAEDEVTSFDTPLYQRAKAYYAERFVGLEMATLSHAKPGTMGQTGRCIATVERCHCDDWCSKQNVQPNLLFQAAFVHVMSVLSHQKKVAFTTTNHGRMDKRLRGSIGMFVKTVPMMVDADPSQRVIDFIRSQRAELMSTIRYGIYPFTHFCTDLQIKPGAMFNFMAVANMEEYMMLDGVKVHAVQPVRKETDSDLTVDIYLRNENYEIRVESSLAMNDEATLRMVAEAMKVAVGNMMAHPELTLKELDIVSAKERAALIELGSGKHIDIDPQMTFVKAFEQCASRVPDNIAVADAANSLTYRELSRRSDILAQRLIDCCVKPNDFVAVKLDRTIDFPLAVIAIHKAGAAYVPIDLEYPEERQQYMLDDCKAKVVIDRQFIAETDFEAETRSQRSLFNVQSSIDLSSSDGLAYMIYTSGSTGRPKGVMIGQRGLTSYIASIVDILGITAADHISLHRPFSFDAHIQDLYPVLTIGGSLHIMPSEIRRDIQGMRDFINSHGITGGSYTTSLGKLLIESGPLPLRYMTLTGERMVDMVSGDIQLFNGYGPTECTDLISAYRLEHGRSYTNIPIGRPMANSYCFIVDAQNHLLPRGAEGELCFASVQVSLGYWQQSELTAKKFVSCPFLPVNEDGQPVRMYRTGDLCRWNDEDQLEFLGRTDEQVKLRGYRIEMGEIEACASKFEGISQAVAVVRPIGTNDTLCLYYTTDGNTTVDTDELRQFLSRTLAEYMVPMAYMQLETLPMTPSGKVDRRHLPEPTFTYQKEYVAPANNAEEVIVRLLGDVMSWHGLVSMLDNFFALGGDSIKLIHLVSLLASEGYTAQVSELMKCSTIRDMARTLISNSDGPTIAQDSVTGVITPGAVQQRFLSWDLQQPGQFTQSVVFRTQQPVNRAHLEQALQALAVHHDMLRATVDDTIVIRPTTDNHLFALQEMTLPNHADAASIIAEVATRQSEQIDLKHGPILRTVLLHTDEGVRLLMVCHHIAIDGVSWRILHDDLTTAMNQLAQGQAIVLPKKTHSFAYWTNTVSRYRNSYLLQMEKPYWQQVQEQMESMDLTTSVSTQTQELTVNLEGEPLQLLLTQSAKAYNTEINDLLLTALTQSYYQLTGNNALTIQMEGHGREPLHEPVVIDRTVGWFTSVYPVIIQGISGDIRHDVRMVKELMRSVPNKGIGYGILQYLGDDKLRTDLTPLVGFNYLGEVVNSNGEMVLTKSLEIPLPSIDINCAIVGGRFVARFEYDAARWTDDKAQQLADAFVENLVRVATHTAQATVPEPTASDFGATGWTEEQLQDVMRHLAIRGEKLQRVYPLSPMQESILVTYLSNRDTTAYRLLFRLAMNMLPTEATLKHTLDYLATKHEVLRTSILFEGVPQPCQAIVSRQLSLEMRDLTGEPDIEAAATAVHQEMLHRKLSLTDDPMFHLICMKTGTDSCQLLVMLHHIVIDGWCIPIIFKDFLMKLDAETAGKSLPATTEQNGRYEAFVRQLLSRDRKTGLAYWNNLLADYDTRAAIPSYEKPDATQIEPRLTHTFDKELTASLRQLATTTGVTLNTVMELGWGLVLQTYCRTEDVVFVKVVSGREGAGVDNNQLVGLFINSIPVRVHTESTETIRQSLKNLQKQAAHSSSYDFCPLSEIMAQTELGSSLFQSIVAFENYPVDDTFWASFQNGKIKPIQVEEEPFCELSLGISPTPEGTLQLTFTYDTSLYTMRQMRQVAETYETIIRGMVTMTDSQIKELPLVTEADQTELLELGRGKKIDIDPQMTFVKAFEQCASQHPERLAVADADSSLTYGELSRRSDILAYRLIASGVSPNDFVAVMLDRTVDFPQAVIAIHKAGAAYIPLDIDNPIGRLKMILSDSQPKAIVTTHTVWQRLMQTLDGDANQPKLVFVDDVDFSAMTEPVCRTTPDHLAYMIYTSGSTGRPKGVMIRQRNLSSYIASIVDVHEITSADHISLFYSFAFDGHIHDLYPELTVGGSLHIIPSELRHDIQGIKDFIVKHSITGGNYPTSLGTMLLESGSLPLRFMGMGGERMKGLVSRDVQLFNCYGPTECTDLIAVYKLEHGRSYTRIPVGRPMANSHCFIVDGQNRLLPRSVVGELCFASPQVGLGYLNRPELTAEKFVPCPFLPNGDDGQPVRMYRTGDLCRWNDEGQLEFIGRIDYQVKLRGFRIELGEIESCASMFEGITQAVAIVRQIGGSDTLCLYYTADSDIDSSALCDHMACSLAEYMVPTAYMQIEAMPLTSNGKIDRRRLPEPTLHHAGYVAPRNELEKLIVSGIEKVLNQEKISVNDDFVLLGGDSLSALKLVLSLDGTGITVADVLSLRTPAAIASHTEGFTVDLNKYTIESGCPLNNSQLFIFNDIVKFGKYDSYLIPSVIPIDRKYTDDQIRQVLDVMFTAHPVLTMHVAMRDGVPFMEKGDKPTVMKGSLNPLKLISQLTANFDLYSYLSRHVIVRFLGKCYLLSIFHHLIFDAVSTNVFTRHFLRVLQGETLDFVDDHFLQVSAFHQEVKSTEQYAEMEKYIRTMLSNLTETQFYRNLGKRGKPGYHKRELGVSREQVNRFTERFGITKDMLFTAAMSITLSKLTGSDDVAFGFLENGRDRFRNFEDLGLYITGMPLVIHVDHHDMKAFLDHLTSVYYTLRQNNYFPFASLVQEYNIAPIILFQYFPDWILEDGKYDHLPKNEMIINKAVSTQKDFMVEALADVSEIGNSYFVRITYSGYYSRKMMKTLAATYKETINEMLKV